MSKPEIVGYLGRRVGPFDAPFYPRKSSAHPDDVARLKPLIRLTDHEAASAADKARIAELTEALKSAREMVSDWGAYASEYFREKHGLEKDLAELDAAIDAAISQQGKKKA